MGHPAAKGYSLCSFGSRFFFWYGGFLTLTGAKGIFPRECRVRGFMGCMGFRVYKGLGFRV